MVCITILLWLLPWKIGNITAIKLQFDWLNLLNIALFGHNELSSEIHYSTAIASLHVSSFLLFGNIHHIT